MNWSKLLSLDAFIVSLIVTFSHRDELDAGTFLIALILSYAICLTIELVIAPTIKRLWRRFRGKPETEQNLQQ